MWNFFSRKWVSDASRFEKIKIKMSCLQCKNIFHASKSVSGAFLCESSFFVKQFLLNAILFTILFVVFPVFILKWVCQSSGRVAGQIRFLFLVCIYFIFEILKSFYNN